MQWAKFAPRGIRGLNTSGYDANYGGKTLPELAHDANRDSFVAIQIETLGALEECDAIAAIDGVDMLFVGPSDLSQELGVLGQWEGEKLWSAYERVTAACKKHGKHWHDRRQPGLRTTRLRNGLPAAQFRHRCRHPPPRRGSDQDAVCEAVWHIVAIRVL